MSEFGSLITLGYIDAATGAMIIQWIGAAIVGVTVLYRATILRFIKFLMTKITGKGEGRKAEEEE